MLELADSCRWLWLPLLPPSLPFPRGSRHHHIYRFFTVPNPVVFPFPERPTWHQHSCFLSLSFSLALLPALIRIIIIINKLKSYTKHSVQSLSDTLLSTSHKFLYSTKYFHFSATIIAMYYSSYLLQPCEC